MTLAIVATLLASSAVAVTYFVKFPPERGAPSRFIQDAIKKFYELKDVAKSIRIVLFYMIGKNFSKGYDISNSRSFYKEN